MKTQLLSEEDIAAAEDLTLEALRKSGLPAARETWETCMGWRPGVHELADVIRSAKKREAMRA